MCILNIRFLALILTIFCGTTFLTAEAQLTFRSIGLVREITYKTRLFLCLFVSFQSYLLSSCALSIGKCSS